MVGIVDIAGIRERVEVAPGKEIEFIGWSARAVASLRRRFPFLQEVVQGKSMTLVKMIEVDSTAAGAALAAGVKGGLENTEMEEAFSDLPLQAQLDCFKAIQKVSFPKGLLPFLMELYGTRPTRPETSSPEEQPTPEDSSASARTNGSTGPDTSTPDTTSPKPSSDSVASNILPSGISPLAS